MDESLFSNTSALLVIDVQTDIFAGRNPLPDWDQVRGRIKALAAAVQERAGSVIYIQHDGGPGDPLEPGLPGWALDAELVVAANDVVVRKTASDAFFRTSLMDTLKERGVRRLYICGCWTNYCVDTTCRSAVSNGFDVTLVSDAHACADSGALSAAQIVAHHNATLYGFDAGPCSVRLAETRAVLA